MATLDGPHPISANLQVRLPRKVANALRIQGGDEFYWRRSDDDPDVLLFIPSEVVERRYSVGSQLEAAARPAGTQLPTTQAASVSPPERRPTLAE